MNGQSSVDAASSSRTRTTPTTALLFAALLFGFTEDGRAELVPVGPEFQVNAATPYSAALSAVCSEATGGFVAAWHGTSPNGHVLETFAQRFDGEGARLGSPFQVNTFTTGPQSRADVCCPSSGGFVVVWSSNYQDGSGRGVFGRRYDSTGSPDGTEFQVNTYTTSSQNFPAIACQADGEFIVVWHGIVEFPGPPYPTMILGQRYDGEGNPAGTEFRVNSYTETSASFADIATQPDGGFVVAWHSYGQDGEYDGVFGQRFASGGDPAGTEFQINTHTEGHQSFPRVSVDESGHFVVVWGSWDHFGGSPDGSYGGVFGQRFDSTGMPEGTEFQINTYTTGDQLGSDISHGPDGDFVVVWTSLYFTHYSFGEGQDGSYGGIFAQRFDSAGNPSGAEFQVNTYTTDYQTGARVASNGAGKYVVVWGSDRPEPSQHAVFGQHFVDDILMTCGDPTGDGIVTASDALVALQAAISLGTCNLCICDVNQQDGTTAIDALVLLQAATGLDVDVSCVAC